MFQCLRQMVADVLDTRLVGGMGAERNSGGAPLLARASMRCQNATADRGS